MNHISLSEKKSEIDDIVPNNSDMACHSWAHLRNSTLMKRTRPLLCYAHFVVPHVGPDVRESGDFPRDGSVAGVIRYELQFWRQMWMISFKWLSFA